MEQEIERWITYKRKHLPVGKDGKIIKFSNNSEEKKYIGEKYTPENVNDYFKNIKTYGQYEEFFYDFLDKTKMPPYIVPIRNPRRQWVDFIEKIDDENISFSVLSYDYVSSRKAKSSLKNFVKNYKVHME